MMMFYFHLVCFTCSISCSGLPFHLVYVFQFLHLFSFFFFNVLSQAFINHSRKAFVYIYINNMYSIYIFKNLEFLPKKFMTF